MAKLLEVQLDNLPEIGKYESFNPEIYRAILDVSKKLRGKTIIHINSTARSGGGGVAELLRSQVTFEKSLGLDSHWLTIEKVPQLFFVITKKIFNLLQGGKGLLDEEEKKFYLSINQKLAKSLEKFCRKFKDAVVVIHDPQPLPLVQFIPQNFYSVLRFHNDFSAPDLATLDFLRPLIEKYQAVILSNETYLDSMSWLKTSKARIIMPAIDPLREKNRFMEISSAQVIIEKFSINPLKPLVTQVSRFDQWKNPLGVIQAYYLAKKDIPNLQLALAGFFLAADDPEAINVYNKVKKHARGDQDIHLFADTGQLINISNDVFINALYTASAVVIQNSISEGFGLTITEAMWKGKAVIAGMASGPMLQIKNGENGILVSSSQEIARAIKQLIQDKNLRERLGKAARESVRRQFLLPRFILDNIKLYDEIF